MVLETVRRARQRILANEAMRHAAYAASTALGALVLLLLAGTQVLSWAWLFVLPALAAAVGIFRTWWRCPSLYQAAQRVDRNLKLADTLSTALFFSAAGRAGEGIRSAQRSQAERVAAGVNLRAAVPMRIPRACYTTAILGLIAGSLFALRYGLDRRLDLSMPLARVVQEKLGYPEPVESARKRNQALPHDPRNPDEIGVATDNAQPKGASELDAAGESALDTVGEPEVDNSKAASKRSNTEKASPSTELESEKNESDRPEGVSANPGNQQRGSDGKQGQGAGKPGNGADKQEASGNNGESSNLLSKFRDAMSSLLNRMRQSGGNGVQQQASARNGQQKSQTGKEGQNGQPGQQPGDGQQADAKEGQQGDDSQNAQSSQSGSNGENGKEASTKQPGSGIGRQDGSKDVKLAEQLAAMGKISEIIGKRSTNVTGELTVEVQNSNQQLRTPYTQRDAHHAEAGGEINRDEIPAALQAYVQQYFEQLRKQAAAAGAPHARHRAETSKPSM
ncbi:MAG TPA: hypothetical protein VMT86_18120 [Bryobacteraceae bacterium]|nr:hypothetical protein [Bryobacteraceae bacterium]